ncbi:carbon-nitrogen hydrolase family protein [Erwinia psidii]|uniref:Carbon-nitrogen hydrolase family protein n=1 Tax=Erwinia psidii TaxID=69224 RepID=A0A3N6SK81_9GAMM|nr:carbon-nitrogen hydrolase family protein [Erwinia psidii]MCX8956208.1 carbon-nitrogen hydrolase family protein [Erwinia psidii]MCX8960032.1 carbon-nitrogen hydrolase family protein [Erwinia psidii]MCX8963577.1 carbon-nitrogen hydrolase family protein [Erwinia psidii]RQM39211.1 carbon-nitrogen hydrolase family protein [Erwinia psidii]
MSVWSVAAAQSGSRPGDIDWNISRHLEFIHQAAEHQVNVLVFPELSLTGYELALSQQLSMKMDDPRLEPFSTAASQHQMTIVIGLPLRDGDHVLICALAFLAEGTRMAYGKRHLSGDENLFFQPGTGVPLFGYQQHHIALAVCADISVKEYAKDAAERGANLYATGVLMSEKSYQKGFDCLARWSADYNMAVLMANHALPTGGYNSAGKSAIWNDRGQQVVVGGRGEALVIARRTEKGWQGETHLLR